MDTQPINEVTIRYTHTTSNKRKRNGKKYSKKICVRAPNPNDSISRASSIFIQLHPNTKIVSVDNCVVYCPILDPMSGY